MRDARACIKSLWGMSRPVRWRMAVNVGIGILRIAASLGFVAASKLLVDIATGNSTMAIGPAIGLFLDSFSLWGQWHFCAAKVRQL
ncbi:MAG: hypothetical protein J5519_01385, partial [Bacteroidales bacterium]|nr:hypothetical protein [Bacteroidales bacterium]